MKRSLSLLLISGLALLLIWGSMSWYLSRASEQAFHNYVSELSNYSQDQFFEVSVEDYQETFVGAEALVTVNFAIPSLKALFGELKLNAKRLNGPVFINNEGIQFGAARWNLSINQTADKVVSNTIETLFGGETPAAIIRFGFSDKAYFTALAKHFYGSDFRANQLNVEGEFDFGDRSYELSITSENTNILIADSSLALPEMDIAVRRLAQKAGLDARANAAVVDLVANDAELRLSKQGKKIPLDLSSRGSLWLINDTLSGDWQMLFKSNPDETARQLRVDLQFREWIAEGFLAYWRQQAMIASLNEQAEWALEEGAETPEEQDFIMSLYGDAERIKQSLSRDILGPMLKYEHSQLVLKALLKDDVGELGRVTISAETDGSEQQPQLALSGDAGVTTEVLNSSAKSLLDQWYQRFWLRRYESAFEADIAVRNQQFLLNNIRVSWEDLSSELKQLLNDQ